MRIEDSYRLGVVKVHPHLSLSLSLSLSFLQEVRPKSQPRRERGTEEKRGKVVNLL